MYNRNGGGVFGFAYHICCCLACLICLGPLLIIIGVIILFTATVNTRGTEISLYNTAITSWNNTYMPEFAAINGVSIISPINMNLMKDTTTPDTLMDTGTDFSGYNVLKYDAMVNLPSFTYTTQNVGYTLPIQITVGGTNLTFSVNPIVQTTLFPNQLVPTCAINNVRYPACSQVCQSNLGVWDAGTQVCNLTAIVTQLCVKVSGSWQLDSTFGGNGCQPSNAVETPTYTATFPYNGAWPIEKYKLYLPPNIGQVVTLPVEMIVRHADDPFVVAGSITDGSYYFGTTTGQKLATGFILIIVGGVFTLPAILTVVLICYCVRRN